MSFFGYWLAAHTEDADRDQERRAKNPYMSRKEALAIAAAASILGVLLYFFAYLPAKARRDWVVSQDNLRSIGKALGLYAAANDEGLPATYLPGGGASPSLDAKGNPHTWANQLFQYLPNETPLENPSNRDEWNTLLTLTDGEGRNRTVSLSYGMISSAAALRAYDMKPDRALFGETIGGGQAGAQNPLPLTERDGFLIGYDDSNYMATSKTRYATRLAFPDSEPLHGDRGTLLLLANGSLKVIRREDLRVGKRGNLPDGLWVPY